MIWPKFGGTEGGGEREFILGGLFHSYKIWKGIVYCVLNKKEVLYGKKSVAKTVS